MNRWPLLALIIVSPLPAAALDDPTISVTGTAQISVRPDQVVLTASVESRKEELSEAKQDNDKRIADVVQFLTKSNVDSKDVQTDYINIEPIYRRVTKSNPFQGTPKQADSIPPSGYVVRRGFNIRIRSIDAFEKVYSGLIERGINRVSGIRFETSQLSELQTEARKQSIEDAKRKAELLVKQLDATLAGVQSIQDSSPSHRFTASTLGEDPFGAATVATPLSLGEIQVSAKVAVVFRMSDTDFQ